MTLKVADLLMIKSFARDFYLKCNGGRLSGETRDLENWEIVALSYVDAVSRLMISRGWNPSDISIEIEHADSDPEAEIADWNFKPNE